MRDTVNRNRKFNLNKIQFFRYSDHFWDAAEDSFRIEEEFCPKSHHPYSLKSDKLETWSDPRVLETFFQIVQGRTND